MTKFYSAYGKKPSADGKGKQGNFGPSRTQQQFAASCDVNNIVKAYTRTADPALLNRRGEPTFADLTGVPSYRDALQKVIDADNVFGRLPAIIRKRFQNNPANLLAFVADDANYAEALKLGLIDPAKADARKAAATPPAVTKPPAEPLPAPQGAQVKGA